MFGPHKAPSSLHVQVAFTHRISLSTASAGIAIVLLLAAAQRQVAAETPTEEAPAPVDRSISGTLVDLAGFPVSNARLYAPQVSTWRGPQSGGDGKFAVKSIPSKATVLVATSERSRKIAVIPLDAIPAVDQQYVLDCDRGSAELHVVDPKIGS
jgi:hypothetical protein